jgi:hypothetical protein
MKSVEESGPMLGACQTGDKKGIYRTGGHREGGKINQNVHVDARTF